MKYFTTIVLTVLAPVAFAPAAFAEEMTGPRAEVVLGWDQLRFDLDEFGTDARAKRSDLGYGVALGYDAQIGQNLIGGVEASVLLSDGNYSFGDATTGGSLDAKRDITLAARLGTKVTDNALLYGKLGYSNFRVGTAAIADGVTTSNTRNFDGVALGVGAEVGLGNGAYLKSEYRYSNYEDGLAKNDILTGIGIRF